MPQYLLFQPNETRSYWSFTGEKESVPEGLTAVEWEQTDGDATIANYELVEGKLVYSPPKLPEPDITPRPNIPAFFATLVDAVANGDLPADVYVKSKMILDVHAVNPEAAAGLLMAFSSDPAYTKKHKLLLNSLILASALELPAILE